VKILIVSQYFWPEKFRINEIALNLKKQGHQVDVLTGKPNYPHGELFEEFKRNPEAYSSLEGVKIYRIKNLLRKNATKIQLFLNYFTFIFNGVLFGTYKIRKKKYDIIFTFATSPITVALLSIWFSKIKNAKHIMWVLDIWPNILQELHIIKNRFVYIILSKIVNFIYKKTDLILAQSIGFKKIIQQKTKNIRIEYVPAWPEPIVDNDCELKKDKDDHLFLDDKKFKIIFTGNIGEAQNFENIMKAAAILKVQKDISWIIVGTGRKIKEFQEFIITNKINNFYFIGEKPLERIGFYHKNSDILLISLSSGKSLSATIPGKLQTYLNSDKVILGFINGETKRIIQESGAGVHANPDSPSDLVEKIIYLKNNRDLTKNIETNKIGSKYVEKFFNKNIILKKIETLLIEQKNNNNVIRMISDVSKIPMNKNFTLSGLNLAFLGFYSKGIINFHQNLYHWPDGIFYKRFFGNKIQKIPGREIISNLIIPNQIKKIYVFGDMSIRGYDFLLTKYKKKIIHINLPHSDAKNLFDKYCNIDFEKSDLIILTLPTPKQEEFAEQIIKNNNFYKILCIGGALAMAAGDEKAIPIFFEKYGFEFLWRLRNDRKRRIKRLVTSLLYFLRAELILKFINQKKILLNDNNDEEQKN
jgi:colanic acid biosynthesis glycosyl transferase WcaI